MPTWSDRFLRFGWWLPLAVPAWWFLVNIPPLWRDSDGFFQIHAEIGGLTLLLWPPLYCLIARVPLAIGAWWEHVPFSFDAPALTDSGVELLVSFQHLLLIAAVAWFISMIAQRDGVRLAVSLVFACVPTFYAFANTVGSESLSNTMQFAVMAGGACLLKSARPRWLPWLGYSTLLALAVLTRHINAVFAALLPIAFFLRAVMELRTSNQSSIASARSAFWCVGIAVMAGVAAIVTADLTVRALCSASGTVYHSKFGFVFQWRAAFVESKSAPERTEFFNAVCARLDDPLAIRALRAYEAAMRAGERPRPGFLSDFIKQNLKKDSSLKRKTRHALTAKTLNRIAFTIATSLPPGYSGAVLEDFRKNFALHLDEMTREPAATTQFFVTALPEPDFKPLQGLVTFRDGYYKKAASDFSKHFYLTMGGSVTLATLTLIAFVLWIPSAANSCPGSLETIYPPTLLAVGWLLIFLNCSATFFMPRFALPLLGTTLAALLIPLACLWEPLSAWKRGNALKTS